MENVTERNNGYMPQRAKGECPAAMDGLKTGMLCCLLDEDLTFQWGNSSFFDSIGYTRESFFGCFRDLRQYYADYPGVFASIRQELAQAAEKNCSDIELPVRLPLKEGGYSWACLYGTMKEEDGAAGPVLQAEFAADGQDDG